MTEDAQSDQIDHALAAAITATDMAAEAATELLRLAAVVVDRARRMHQLTALPMAFREQAGAMSNSLDATVKTMAGTLERKS